MPPPPAHVRPATAADLEAVVDLEQRCLGADAWGAALVAPGLAGELPTVSYLVVEVGGRVVGHAVVSAAGDVAELQRIAVAPEQRRQGLATRLLGAATEDLLGSEAERLLLEVREDNAGAARFYAAEGFAEIARRRRYYADGSTAVVMERRLSPRG
ncbi:[SSU ribosomal protein S18P]-alanine acetyltransferase [Nocardioides scoriae]|uniref:[Ribosomal protein bS18]-alanine N-acetyltransferase n=1 Tax=Nocardioides scoriae TaxID=642780 RepID=A0A1H1SZ66_9ACTN|nr:ribosomal protein S18-alanine N-acetyltransferase [Nocardioides scoriae]SDS53270.1 [SSU ribosomal protein S18P]-alanine acetyltransferase [Nocardioides scoriae]